MKYLHISEIQPNPFQPRRDFKAEELWQLAESIREHGIVEPLIVRKSGKGYELIAGERRLRAAKLAGLETVPAVLKAYDDRQAAQIALIENLQRSDLNAIEEARAYKLLMDKFCLTQAQVAQKVSKSRSYVANFLRLLKLTPEVQQLLLDGALSMGQAKPLLTLTDMGLQQQAAEYIAAKHLSARQAEKLVKQLLKDAAALAKIQQQAKEKQNIYIKDAEQQLQRALGTNVCIRHGKNKSRLEIEFYTQEDLQRLMQLLTGSQAAKSRKKIAFTI